MPLRSDILKIAATLPQGSETRRKLLVALDDGDIPLLDPSKIRRGPSYGHTNMGTSYAPKGMSDDDAAEWLRKRFRGAPLWKFVIAKDPRKNGQVYAYYEIDTSG